LFLRQIDHRTGPNHCGRLTLPIVDHPALGPLANQISGRGRRLVAHLAELLVFIEVIGRMGVQRTLSLLSERAIKLAC
jgi:hypothetical protein